MKKNLTLFVTLLIALMLAPVGCGCGDDDDDNDDAEADDDTAPDDDAEDDDTVPDDDQTDDDADDDTELDDDLDPVDNPLEWVDPFIGTGGLGYGMGALIPGPILPNAPVKLSPDTSLGGFAWDKMHAGGYYYPDNTIRGISHTHLPGIGATDLANINLMPVLGISDQRVTDAGYRSPFRHETEEARVGYYRVTLDRFAIDVELTSTMNAGFHRWTFPAKDDPPYVVVDVSYANVPGTSTDGEVTVDPAQREVYGFTYQDGSFTGRYGGMPVYFVARFSEDFEDYGTFSGSSRAPSGTNETGTDIGAYVGFAPAKQTVLAKVGISVASVAQARANLDAQITDWDFDAVVTQAENVWRGFLSDVLVEGGTAEQRTIFYSALYHLYMLPTSFTEEGGLYVGFDRAEHTADTFTYYTDLSIWDTFRTLHPAMVFLRPTIARDLVISMMKMVDQGGAYPRWAQGLGDTGSMIGTHSDSVVGDAVAKGVGGFDLAEAYEGLRAHAVGPVPYGGRSGLDDWTTLGYVARDTTSGSVSKTLEYAYDDFCLARIADELGEDADRDLFDERAGNYANLWDSATGFFRARDELGAFDPALGFFDWWLWYDEYVEGNARHWRWFVPHDVPGLIDLFGGEVDFIAELEQFFEGGEDVHQPGLPDLWYYHGNEPDIHAPFLFNEAGRPDLTQKWVRWAMDAHYGTGPDGIYGNDDGGTLSAWYVFAALGLYPVAPCTDVYQIGSPIFTKATVKMGDNTLVITAENASPENIYIQEASLNGDPLDVPWVHHADLAAGGTLDFVMGPDPSNWGRP
ncbi:MAG: GH92 family glycosyl hydrolase [Deltaproteobacteria bacterium]|nr:GH92 family glycosyl hydrolase [Deltaproteobacteria bacterium]